MKKGWQTKTLAEVCEIVNGGTPKTGISEYWDGSHLWITPAEMGKRLSPYVSDTERKITDIGLRDSSARMLPPNSVILSSRAPIGHLVINTEPMATNQGCKGLVPCNQLQHKFLYYYLSSIVDLLNSLGTGATFKELSGGKLKEVTIPVPQLLEQQRIVGILDEAFEGIATAKANAEKNLQNARALFESHLQSVFTQRGAYPVVAIGDVGEVFDGPHATPKTIDAGPIFLGISALQDGQVNLGETRHVTPEDYRQWTRRVKPQSGDVVFSYETRLGQAAIIPEGLECCLGRRMGLVRVNRKRLDPRYFVYQYISPPYREFLSSRTVRGATVDRIAIKEFPSFPIYLPNIAEQERLADCFDDLRAETQRLESLYQRKLAALEELKKTLLYQAFSGQL